MFCSRAAHLARHSMTAIPFTVMRKKEKKKDIVLQMRMRMRGIEKNQDNISASNRANSYNNLQTESERET